MKLPKAVLFLLPLLIIALVVFLIVGRSEKPDSKEADRTTEPGTTKESSQPTSQELSVVTHVPEHPTEIQFRAILDDEIKQAFGYSRVVAPADSVSQYESPDGWLGREWAYDIGRELTSEDLKVLDRICRDNFEMISLGEGAESMDEYREWYGKEPLLDDDTQWCVGLRIDGSNYFGCFIFEDKMLWIHVE